VKEPFDGKRAAFYIIMLVLAVQMVVVLSILWACIFAGMNGVDTGSCRDAGIGEMLASGLATALALLGVSRKGDE
jgi:hypothetical protein